LHDKSQRTNAHFFGPPLGIGKTGQHLFSSLDENSSITQHEYYILIRYLTNLGLQCEEIQCILWGHLGANEVQWPNNVNLEKDCMLFCPKIVLSYKWIFEQFFKIKIYNKCL
jgi:hypothetical protein